MFNVSFEVFKFLLDQVFSSLEICCQWCKYVILFSLQSLESVLAGRHTVINAETGSGKTLCTYREGVIIGRIPVHFVVP